MKKPMKKQKPTLAMMIVHHKVGGSEFFHINGIVNEENNDGQYRLAYIKDKKWVSKIYYPQVTCQGSRDRDHTYGWQVAYEEPIRVTLDDAEAMVKHLRLVYRKMAKIAEEYGDAGSFGQYMVYAAKAMGITTFITNGKYGIRAMNAQDAIYHVNELIRSYTTKEIHHDANEQQ